jgi:O-antigen ligase
LWKIGREKRLATAMAFALLVGVFLVAVPNDYGSRLASMFLTEQDVSGSAQARRELLERGVQVASNHLIIGVGMGNYHIYSLNEHVAHNSYLEISAELGVVGLIAYLVMIFAPWRSLNKIGKELRQGLGRDGPLREIYHLSIALQAAFAGYLVCSFDSLRRGAP